MSVLTLHQPSDQELIPHILKEKPEEINYTDFTLIIDGCPKVPKEKYEKLKKFVNDKFAKFGTILYSLMPQDDSGTTLGYMFIAYGDKKTCQTAVSAMHNTLLDAKHRLLVNPLASYDKTVSDSIKKSQHEPIVDAGNLRSWLLNDLCRDQFSITFAYPNVTGAVYWHTSADPILIKEKESWSGKWMYWSRLGSYIATMHQPGVILWGGEGFVKISRFAHPGVTFIDFSSNEQFMITYSKSHSAEQYQGPGILADVIVFNIRKVEPIFEFTIPYNNKPVLRFSHKDNYAACLVKGSLHIYDTKDFSLVDNKPISIADNKIENFEWNPVEDILAYWVPEKDNAPARVILWNVTTKLEISTKNLFTVVEIRLHWQNQGDFLAVEVVRCAKKKQSESQLKLVGKFVNIEIVRMRERAYPWDKLEIKDCELSLLQWEPFSNRFAFVTNHSVSHKTAIAVYQVMKSGKIKECGLIDRSTIRVNELKWSTKGGFMAIGCLHSADGYIEFVDASECQSLAKHDQSSITEIHWDPTGRYLASCVLTPQHNDNGVTFFSCLGRLLHKMPVKELHSFAWRPRPPTLLSQEQIVNVKKNLSTKITHFENEDKMLASKASRELLEKRATETKKFETWRIALEERYLREKTERDQLRGENAESAVALVEEVVEVILNRVRELQQKNPED